MSQFIQFRLATKNDAETLHRIQIAAFTPIFASFQEILGETIYDLAQSHEDAAQAELLDSMLASESDWTVFVAELSNTTVGFISLLINRESQGSEIGLNAHDEFSSYGTGGWGRSEVDCGEGRLLYSSD